MDKNTLKSYFLTGKKPTQGQFAELIDSFFHKGEKINISNIENLSVLLGKKVERDDVPYLIDLDGKQDCISDMLQTTDKSIVGAINELEARKVNLYQERTIIIAPRYQEYAKIFSIKSGSFVLDFEINEYPSSYYYGYWDKSYTTKKYNDRLMISAGRNGNNACTFRTKDFAYNLYADPENGYTDVYIKTDSNAAKMISLRLSFATNDAKDIVYYEYPVYMKWDDISGNSAMVDTLGDMNGAIEVTYSELKELFEMGRLQPGAFYLITDFRTIYKQPVSGIEKSGEEEPLIVQAVSNSKLSVTAKSVIHPADVIHYELTPDCDWNTGNSKGQITYRKCTINNNECHYDFRAVTFLRWYVDFREVEEWDSNNVYYNQNKLVKYNGNIYICVQGNLSSGNYDDQGYIEGRCWNVFYENVHYLDGSMQNDDKPFWKTNPGNNEQELVPFSKQRRYNGEFVLTDLPGCIGDIEAPTPYAPIECYTFNIINETENQYIKCYNNKIEKAYSTEIQENKGNIFKHHTLNNIVLYGANENIFDYDCKNSTLVFSYKNKWGIDCEKITLAYSDNNSFGDHCNQISMIFSCKNMLKILANQITFFYGNLITIGEESYSASFYNSHRIVIGKNCYGITFKYVTYTELSDGVDMNYFEYSSNNKLGDNCRYNYFYHSHKNTLRQRCDSNSFKCSTENDLSGTCTGNNFEYSTLNVLFANAMGNRLYNSHKVTLYQNTNGNTIDYGTSVIIEQGSHSNKLEKAGSIFIGRQSQSNKIIGNNNFLGAQCQCNTIEGHDNKLGSLCNNNEIKEWSANNTFENNCTGNKLYASHANIFNKLCGYNYLRISSNNTFENQCSYIGLYNSQLNYIEKNNSTACWNNQETDLINISNVRMLSETYPKIGIIGRFSNYRDNWCKLFRDYKIFRNKKLGYNGDKLEVIGFYYFMGYVDEQNNPIHEFLAQTVNERDSNDYPIEYNLEITPDPIPDQTYTGLPVTFAPEFFAVHYKNIVLTPEEYDIVYENNIWKGERAKVIISAKNYPVKAVRYFTIY